MRVLSQTDINVTLAQELTSIAFKMEQNQFAFQNEIDCVQPNHVQSAINLLHYLTLRSHDIRSLQEALHRVGLSSLTSSESHTLFQLQNAISWLQPDFIVKNVPCNFDEALAILKRNTSALFGQSKNVQLPHIMVTLDGTQATNLRLMEDMLTAGMTVARINCAHDLPSVWSQMIDTLKQAMLRSGKTCKIYMDLAGPKIRIKSIWRRGHLCEEVRLGEGDDLTVTTQEHLPMPWNTQPDCLLVVEPTIVLHAVKVNDRIYFDDGKFEGIVTHHTPHYFVLRISRISTKKPALKSGKGMNVPDSELPIHALTEEDKTYLPFVCQHADLVGFSFVGKPEEVTDLQYEINRHTSRNKPGIILKIERLKAIQNLPALLLAAMREQKAGVMIARGDLAVEIGFERLSEIQEEILWICEAAHTPVIWATQVLENMNKTGFATRSEITDAANAVKAECVMLNKGRFVAKAITTLVDILDRQANHIDKKRYTFRPLNIARGFLAE
ncbi:MAG: pyruvate kinase [Cyclobacteriaceae bacterium]|nr:pyruvate kinase [Cyclobacteriaceae bacterium]